MILILDFGSQVTQLIARRVREANIYCEIHPFDRGTVNFIKEKAVKGIILSGSPFSIHDEGAPFIDKEIFTLGLPILGICYGQQMMTHLLGGVVEKPFAKETKNWSHLPLDTPTDELPDPDQLLEKGEDMSREFGFARLDIIEDSLLTKGIVFEGKNAQVWMSHGDKVVKLADGFKRIGKSEGAPFGLIADETRHFYGLQFHPEVVHTVMGAKLIKNFLTEICGLSANWTMENYKQSAMDKIKRQVGDGHVICGLSGGVDSAVTAVLIHQAIGDQLTCILVDHGLMRADEATQVIELFRNHYHINLIHVDAGDIFLTALDGQDDPEVKRKTIGRLFIEVFEKEAKKIKDARFLAQGTLYPDVIESVSFQGGPSHTIKSHHNVGGLPEKMNLELVEPLRELFKDEVRKLGRELGMPKDMVMRHPFPGPGLGIRIPGVVTKPDCDLLRQVDKIYLEEIRKAGLYDEIWQAFAVLLPVKTVGVMGDGRSYERAVALRAVTSHDGMTAESYGFSHEFLTHTATRIINNVSGVNRVLYDVTSKPPGTIEWE